MPVENDFDSTMKMVKLGTASKEVMAYLNSWLQNECESIWKAFINCDADLNKLLQIQARGKSIDKLQTDLILNQVLGEDAKTKFEKQVKKGAQK